MHADREIEMVPATVRGRPRRPHPGRGVDRRRPARGLISFAILAGAGALFLLGGRSETIRGLRGDGRDERFRQIDIHATALAGLAIILAIIIAFLVELALGHNGSPYTWLGAIGGLTYIAAIIHLQNPRLKADTVIPAGGGARLRKTPPPGVDLLAHHTPGPELLVRLVLRGQTQDLRQLAPASYGRQPCRAPKEEVSALLRRCPPRR